MELFKKVRWAVTVKDSVGNTKTKIVHGFNEYDARLNFYLNISNIGTKIESITKAGDDHQLN